MRPVSIGVQAAAMIDCPCRVPLIIHAKLRKIDVKDPVDLAAVRRGRLIHAAFEEAATRLDEAGKLGDEVATTAGLAVAIASALPYLDTGTVAAQASSIAATITAAVTGRPGVEVTHERHVSLLLVPGVKVSGRVDTIIEHDDGWILVERKTGEHRPWHARQVQLYADMVLAAHPGTRTASPAPSPSPTPTTTASVRCVPTRNVASLSVGTRRADSCKAAAWAARGMTAGSSALPG
jgi:RecB family exonuclease